MIDEDLRYAERAVSWRPLWIVAGLIVVGFCIDVALPGGDHLLAWAMAFVAIVGVMAISLYARAQFGSVSVSALRLKVGRESVPLSTVDLAYLRDSEAGGPPVGARVLGGGWSVPKGRSALPVRLTDGAVVLVPCRDPDAVRTALLGLDQTAL